MVAEDVLLRALRSQLGDCIEHKKEGEYSFHCPFCNHYKKKLQVNLEKNKWRDVVMGRQHQDMYNFVQRDNRDNNNLSIAQWLEKAKNSIKGAVTGQPAEPVSYNAARFDPNARGYGQDVTKPEKAFPMKESNEIVKLSKMLNG